MRAEGDVPAFLALGPGEWQLPEGTLYGAISSGQPVWPGRHEDSHALKSHLDYQGGAEAGANGPTGTGASPVAATCAYPCLRIFEA